MKPLVSILIPAYNAPQYIGWAVRSALDQDYENLEVIVSDDSTNDHTYEALRPFLSDIRFSYHRNSPKLGRVGNYRRLLFDLANGEWVIMLDGDDYFIDRSYISKAIGFIEQDAAIVLVGAGVEVLNESAGTREHFGLTNETLVFNGKEVFSTYNRLPNHQTDLYLKDLARELDFYRHPSTGSDSESLFRLCLHGKVAYLAEDVAVWRIHSSNSTFVHTIEKQLKELSFIDSVYQYAVNFLDRDTAKKWRRRMYRAMILHLLNLAYSSGKHLTTVRILMRYGIFVGPKLSIVYLLRTVGFYRPDQASFRVN